MLEGAAERYSADGDEEKKGKKVTFLRKLAHFFKLDAVFPDDVELNARQKILRALGVIIAFGFALTCLFTAAAGFMGLMNVILAVFGVVAAPMLLFGIGLGVFGIASMLVNWNLSVTDIVQALMRFPGGRKGLFSKNCFKLIDSSDPLKSEPTVLDEEMGFGRKLLLIPSGVISLAVGFTVGGLTFLVLAPILGPAVAYAAFAVAFLAMTIMTCNSFYDLIREKNIFKNIRYYPNKIALGIKKHVLKRAGVDVDTILENAGQDPNMKMRDKFKVLDNYFAEDPKMQREVRIRKAVTVILSVLFIGILVTGLVITVFSSSMPGIEKLLANWGANALAAKIGGWAIAGTAFAGESCWFLQLGVVAANQFCDLICDAFAKLASLVKRGKKKSGVQDKKERADERDSLIISQRVSTDIESDIAGNDAAPILPNTSGSDKAKENPYRNGERFYRIPQLFNAFVNMILALTGLFADLQQGKAISIKDRFLNGFGAPGALTASGVAGNKGSESSRIDFDTEPDNRTLSEQLKSVAQELGGFGAVLGIAAAILLPVAFLAPIALPAFVPILGICLASAAGASLVGAAICAFFGRVMKTDGGDVPDEGVVYEEVNVPSAGSQSSLGKVVVPAADPRDHNNQLRRRTLSQTASTVGDDPDAKTSDDLGAALTT